MRVLRVWRNWFVFSNDYLNGLQATFLKTNIDDEKKEDDNALQKAFEMLSSEELEHKCRLNGLSLKGGRLAQIIRLAQLEEYLNGSKKNISLN